jgi:Fe-S oxidoreductase
MVETRNRGLSATRVSNKTKTCQLEKVDSAIGSKGLTSPVPLIEPNDKAREAACDCFLARRCHTQCWSLIWYDMFVETPRKITVEVPQDLLAKAQRASGTGITQTVRTGLQLVAASRTYARLRQLRGKVRFSRTVAKLKADR